MIASENAPLARRISLARIEAAARHIAPIFLHSPQ